MILYNVTVKINNEVHDDWLRWMQEEHIPDMMATGLFTENKLCRIFQDDPDGVTYAIQYLCKDMAAFEDYRDNYAQKLQKEHAQRFDNQYVAFRTLMEVL